METMPGWASRAAATASSRNRATKVVSAARCGWSTFTATWRCRTSSVPCHTWAMPPEATSDSSR